MRAIALVARFLVFGCSSEKDKKCEKYADMEIKCGGYPVEEHDVTRKMATGFCLEALGGDDLLNLKPEIECAQKGNECSAYQSCQATAEGL